ncbi:sigma-E processing peptidase SpoIIGA [Ornithinibacillus sp. L9]|uniref:Sporulation sigma-E factor-processing peptidase n=1 Tax=Ornithinibacillus caprae TaxID=2678566 RepID=A0A6N8FLC2_9BACI|nr:sigma-E processing peptidase SpoIIGA [Ornithinibacillus caprae]MUK89526.1 sigma-E processing peptidase SpoIIGA [Ornithinibacillus caprae]
MTIYLDVVWALNFFLDMMLLLLTQALARENVKKYRLFIGAFVASLLVPITLYFPDSFFTSLLGKLLYSVLIILSSFHFYSIYRTIKLLLLFYFTSFSVGGGLIAAHFLFQSPIGLTQGGFLTFDSGYGDPVSWIFVIIGFPIAWWFTKIRMDKHAVEKIRYDQLYPVTISLKNKSFSTTGYIDSGNQLVDPLTKRPVIICDESFLKQWFTEDEWKSLKEAYETLDIENIPKSWEKYMQIIPYHGVEGRSRFLFAIKPEQLIVYYDENKIITNKIVIGIQFGDLTKDHQYHCLLHPQIFKLSTVHSA